MACPLTLLSETRQEHFFSQHRKSFYHGRTSTNYGPSVATQQVAVACKQFLTTTTAQGSNSFVTNSQANQLKRVLGRTFIVPVCTVAQVRDGNHIFKLSLLERLDDHRLCSQSAGFAVKCILHFCCLRTRIPIGFNPSDDIVGLRGRIRENRNLAMGGGKLHRQFANLLSQHQRLRGPVRTTNQDECHEQRAAEHCASVQHFLSF